MSRAKWPRRPDVIPWMRRYIQLNTARMLALPVPGYWNRKWDRRAKQATASTVEDTK